MVSAIDPYITGSSAGPGGTILCRFPQTVSSGLLNLTIGQAVQLAQAYASLRGDAMWEMYCQGPLHALSPLAMQGLARA